MELNEMMDKELKRRFEDLENLKTGSDEQSKATDNIVKLYKLRMDENEQNVRRRTRTSCCWKRASWNSRPRKQRTTS